MDFVVEDKSLACLKRHFSSAEFRSKRLKFWDNYFEKYEVPTVLRKRKKSLKGVGFNQLTKQTSIGCLDEFNSRNSTPTPKHERRFTFKDTDRRMNSANLKHTRKTRNSMQAQLRSYVLDSDKNKDVFKTNPVAMLSDVCKSKLKKKESAMSISYPTTSEDFNKIRIHSLFEDDLKSDLKYRLFKRYRSQIENNQSDFDFWNSSAKEELYKLCKIVSIDDLRTYMASSLEQSILEHSQQNTS